MRLGAAAESVKNWKSLSSTTVPRRCEPQIGQSRSVHNAGAVLLPVNESTRAQDNTGVTADIAARGATRSAFERRCIPSGCVAPPSNIPDILGRRALPDGRIAALGATMDLHHGPLEPRRETSGCDWAGEEIKRSVPSLGHLIRARMLSRPVILVVVDDRHAMPAAHAALQRRRLTDATAAVVFLT